MARSTDILILRVMGEDHTFFSRVDATPGPLLVVLPDEARARCEMQGALFDDHTGQVPELLLWVQCGALAGPAPDGEALCQAHLAGWRCDACGGWKASYDLNGGLCDACATN